MFENLMFYLSPPQMICYGLENPLLLNPREAAKALSISERALWTLTASGQIPSIRLGRSVRYSVNSLEQWIALQTQKATTNG